MFVCSSDCLFFSCSVVLLVCSSLVQLFVSLSVHGCNLLSVHMFVSLFINVFLQSKNQVDNRHMAFSPRSKISDTLLVQKLDGGV